MARYFAYPQLALQITEALVTLAPQLPKGIPPWDLAVLELPSSLARLAHEYGRAAVPRLGGLPRLGPNTRAPRR